MERRERPINAFSEMVDCATLCEPCKLELGNHYHLHSHNRRCLHWCCQLVSWVLMVAAEVLAFSFHRQHFFRESTQTNKTKKNKQKIHILNLFNASNYFRTFYLFWFVCVSKNGYFLCVLSFYHPFR